MKHQFELPGPVYFNADLVDNLERVNDAETRIFFSIKIGDWPFSLIVNEPYARLVEKIAQARQQSAE